MADIALSHITDATTVSDGTGILDSLLKTVNLHINEQYNVGRITGADYATVYLGALQTTLSEAIKFALGEQTADKQADLLSEQIESENKQNEDGGVIDLEKKKLQEATDLISAQTAAQYESINASKQDTVRKNLLNSKQVIKLGTETTFISSQNSELLENGPVDRALTSAKTEATISGATDNTNKTNAEVALINANEADAVYVTANIRPEEKTKIEEEIDLLQSRDLEQLAATARQDAESAKKVELIAAQTLGFTTNAKQKLLSSMFEGYAINTTTNDEVGTAPGTTTATGLDGLANSILSDLGDTSITFTSG